MTHLSEVYHSEAKSSVIIFGSGRPSHPCGLGSPAFEITLKESSVEAAVAFPCLSINEFTNSSNFEFVAVTLKHIDERKNKNLSGPAIATTLNRKFAAVREACCDIPATNLRQAQATTTSRSARSWRGLDCRNRC